VISFVVEVVAYARGRKAGRVPLAGGMQQAAARLVAAIALLGALAGTRGAPGVGTAAGPGGLAAAPAAPVTLVAEPSAFETPGGTATPSPAEDAAGPACEVQWRDTLWDIAERHLGDPLRWTEIFELNKGRIQADGGCLTDPDRIEPGWRLLLPADARLAQAPDARPADAGGAEAAGAPDTGAASPDGGMVLLDDDAVADVDGEAGPGVAVMPVTVEEPPPPAPASGDPSPAVPPPAVPPDVTVERGDNFWALAEQHLADAWGRAPTDAEVADHWVDLIDRNVDRLAPPGDPDLIYPGQVFTLPEPPADPASRRSLAPGEQAGDPTGDAAAAGDDCDDPPAGTG